MNASQPPWLRVVTEYVPLVAFFAAYVLYDLMAATVALMITAVLATVVALVVTRTVPWMTVVTAVLVMLFGGLTLYFQDETFIKMKPTVVNSMFAVVLLGSVAFDKPALKFLLQAVLPLTHQGWRVLSRRFGLFFMGLAVLNEVVWRSTSTDFWVSFKVFGVLVITLAFLASQALTVKRYMEVPPEGAPPA